MPAKTAIILSRARTSQPDTEKLEKQLLAELQRWPQASVTVIPHLYDLSPEGPTVHLLRRFAGDLIVLSWLYPRASYWVLDANQVRGRLGRTTSLTEGDEEPTPPQKAEGPERTIWCMDLRTSDQPASHLKEIAEIIGLGELSAIEESSTKGNGHSELVEEAVRQRWYPVIDYQRCENCLECLNFCLFGVFGLDASNRIVTEQPDACRPGCPACSRICPQGAIMFPEHNDPGIAGDPTASKGLKLDLSQLFRMATPAELAAAERQRALAEQQQQEASPRQQSEPPDKQTDTPSGQDSLDHLVDEVDDMDL